MAFDLALPTLMCSGRRTLMNLGFERRSRNARKRLTPTSTMTVPSRLSPTKNTLAKMTASLSSTEMLSHYH